MTVSALFATLGAFFVAAASPGPATLAVATTAMARGARGALALGFGLSLGLALWGGVAAVGLGTLFEQWAAALFVLRLAGGVYLLYLAWQSARSAVSAHDEQMAEVEEPDTRLFRRGLILNLSNPKAVLAWMAVLSFGVGPGRDVAVLALTTLACGLLGTAIYTAYALAFAQASIRSAYRSSRRVIEGVVAACFGYAGIRLLTSRGGL